MDSDIIVARTKYLTFDAVKDLYDAVVYKHGILQPPCPASEDKEHHFVSRADMETTRKCTRTYICRYCLHTTKESNDEEANQLHTGMR